MIHESYKISREDSNANFFSSWIALLQKKRKKMTAKTIVALFVLRERKDIKVT